MEVFAGQEEKGVDQRPARLAGDIDGVCLAQKSELGLR